jgi:hypothetical protein
MRRVGPIAAKRPAAHTANSTAVYTGLREAGIVNLMTLNRMMLLERIAEFEASVRAYRQLLIDSSGGFIPEIVQNQNEIERARAALTATYAALEAYINEFGNRPRMSDGVWNVVYSPYANAFTADVLSRVHPSIDGVLDDLNVVKGRIQASTDREFKRRLSRVRKAVDWRNLANFQLTWRESLLIWRRKWLSGAVSLVLLPLLVLFLAHALGWTN